MNFKSVCVFEIYDKLYLHTECTFAFYIFLKSGWTKFIT